MTMVMCSKQHLSNTRKWIHVKPKQHWDWVEKKCCLCKKACYCDIDNDEAASFYALKCSDFSQKFSLVEEHMSILGKKIWFLIFFRF